MKRFLSLIVLLAFVLCASQAIAIEWKITNQATVAWNEVTTMENGSPLPASSVIKYQTYLVNADTDPNKANPIDTGIVDTPTKTFTLSAEGRFYVGIKTLRYEDVGGTQQLVAQSALAAWSDLPEYCKDNVTFGLQYYLIPANVDGMYSE